MSLVCGNCRETIYDGFGLLYQLERNDEGRLLYRGGDYVPPNVAVCDACWQGVPNTEKRGDKDARTEAEASKETVFAYAPADSDRHPFGEWKCWSSIVANDDELTFVKSEAVSLYLPGALELARDVAAAWKADA